MKVVEAPGLIGAESEGGGITAKRDLTCIPIKSVVMGIKIKANLNKKKKYKTEGGVKSLEEGSKVLRWHRKSKWRKRAAFDPNVKVYWRVCLNGRLITGEARALAWLLLRLARRAQEQFIDCTR